MLVASKYEEIWAPEVKDFVFISDEAYTREQILEMEKIMLNTLRFNLTVPTAFAFLHRLPQGWHHPPPPPGLPRPAHPPAALRSRAAACYRAETCKPCCAMKRGSFISTNPAGKLAMSAWLAWQVVQYLSDARHDKGRTIYICRDR